MIGVRFDDGSLHLYFEYSQALRATVLLEQTKLIDLLIDFAQQSLRTVMTRAITKNGHSRRYLPVLLSHAIQGLAAAYATACAPAYQICLPLVEIDNDADEAR